MCRLWANWYHAACLAAETKQLLNIGNIGQLSSILNYFSICLHHDLRLSEFQQSLGTVPCVAGGVQTEL